MYIYIYRQNKNISIYIIYIYIYIYVRETFRYHFVHTRSNAFSAFNTLMFLIDLKTLKTLIPKKAFVYNVFYCFQLI